MDHRTATRDNTGRGGSEPRSAKILQRSGRFIPGIYLVQRVEYRRPAAARRLLPGLFCLVPSGRATDARSFQVQRWRFVTQRDV